MLTKLFDIKRKMKIKTNKKIRVLLEQMFHMRNTVEGGDVSHQDSLCYCSRPCVQHAGHICRWFGETVTVVIINVSGKWILSGGEEEKVKSCGSCSSLHFCLLINSQLGLHVVHVPSSGHERRLMMVSWKSLGSPESHFCDLKTFWYLQSHMRRFVV